MRTDELIIELARAARPVEPLDAPSVRLARWLSAAFVVAVLTVLIIGPRHDALSTFSQPIAIVLAAATLLTALSAAAVAFVMSVPGAERSAGYRALPVLTGAVWTLILVGRLVSGGDPLRRVAAFPIHWACVIEIVGFTLLAGWLLLSMLRRAAPLHQPWAAAFAALAAAALGAAAVQVVCPIDDPAHHLVAHLLPVALLSILATVTGRRTLDWSRRG